MLYLQTKRSLCKQVFRKAKKLVAVSVISTLITGKKIEKKKIGTGILYSIFRHL